MDELLTQENRDYRQKARDFAEKYVRPIAAKYDRLQEYPWEYMEALRKEKLTGVWIPREYGGHGSGLLNLCIVAEEISCACGGMGIAYAVNALGSFPIILSGSEEQKEKWLRPVATGEKLIAFGLSEIEAGSDVGSMKTTAIRDGDHYVINGVKKWNTNGGIAELYTVFAATDPERGSRGISAIVVEKGTPGFKIGKIEDKMGIRCVPVVELEFDNCRVPVKNLLGDKEGLGFKQAMQTLELARPGVAAQAVGLAQGALDLAAQYASERVQFGQPIISFQAINFMLADMATQTEAARQLVYSVARAADQGIKNLGKYSAMAKVFATDTAMKVTTDAVQIYGGNGYMKDYPIEKYMRDAKITQIYEGTNQIQRLVIGRTITRETASKKKEE
ncbi:MAG: acyl-CoA dehydrogenase family protein [Candidatus Eisenbacteria bacterium]|uniref:Acyl-CoA dehydrogenase family protein n=1 Tax=Eiseniibacteriota bacterium TaxID=2212470 RepID=A0A948RYX4_UNCEI|nr:acyl-CoA dehydrogenase family protein [Candidatus Eisenbacteria bacterium]MBU2693390.1 acyl-CoA dehydrogenase family protein [Candidatus Eisenbacteria bacterium]